MASSREPTPTLYKDIWVNIILPSMDEKTLLNFSTASKETRQVAFTELLKRPYFARKINAKVYRYSNQLDDTYLQECAQWGYGTDAQLFRLTQFTTLGFSVMFLGILAELPLRSQTTEQALLSPDAEKCLSVMGCVSMAGISLIFRQLFLHENSGTIRLNEVKMEYIASIKEKAKRLTYLRDELPKQTVTTHSLFRKFDNTSENSEDNSYSCTIL